MSKLDHAQRTATEPRDPSLHNVILARIDEINPTIRTFRLEVPPTAGGIKFLPGQWLDVYVPGIEKPGGFTITSSPSKALRSSAISSTISSTDADDATATEEEEEAPYVELAVQRSPDNVIAEWLWQPIPSILSSELRIRVGGSFVWPPPGVMPTTLRKLVFVAGGVGINPLMSIISHLAEKVDPRYTIHFLYSIRDPGDGQRVAKKLLFLERLVEIFSGKVKGELKLFATPGNRVDGVDSGEGKIDGLDISFKRRRITINDISEILGVDKRSSVVYICGLPTMTDEFVEELISPKGLGLEPHKVLYEKWW